MTHLVETIKREEGYFSVIALPDGKRPSGKLKFTKEGGNKLPMEFVVDVVPEWKEGMPKFCSAGGRVDKKFVNILRATKGLWYMEFVNRFDVIHLTLTFVNARTMKEQMLPPLEVTGGVDAPVVSVREGATEQEMELLAEVLPGGSLHKPFLVGLNRTMCANPTVFDWGGRS